MCRYTSSAKSVQSFGENFSLFWGDRVKRPMGMKARLARSFGRFLHVVNKGIKSGMMRPSTKLRDFVLAAFLQECLLLEHRTQRGISQLRSACVQLVLSNLGLAVSLGLFLRRSWRRRSSKVCCGRTWPLPSDSCLRVILDLFVMSVVV